MKKSVAFLSIAAIAINVYAADERDASRIVKKYSENIEKDANEIFVPEYQRDFVWSQERQSKMIESIILGLPIPSIFVAEDESGRLEIVDGSQRIRTLNAFLCGDLQLINLKKIDH